MTLGLGLKSNMIPLTLVWCSLYSICSEMTIMTMALPIAIVAQKLQPFPSSFRSSIYARDKTALTFLGYEISTDTDATTTDMA